MIEFVLEIAPAAFLPFAHQRTGSNRDLVGRSADHRLHVDPVRVPAEVRFHAVLGAVALQHRHQFLFAQAVFLPVVGIGELILRGVPDKGSDGIVEERSVLHDGRVAHFVFKAAGMRLDGDMCGAALSGWQWRRKPVDLIVEPLVVLHQSSARNLDVGIVETVQREMDFVERLGVRILNDRSIVDTGP